MTQLKNPTAGGASSGVELHIDDLTRDQRAVLGRLTHRFRETAVVQVLVGPAETGKTTLAEMVGKCLEDQAEAVHLSKSQDPTGTQKRLMFEAYGSYPYFLSAILKQLGFFARGEEPDLVEQLVEQLHRLRSEEKRLLVIIDNADDMNPAVWKRFQSWLDYQDRGMRMIQVLLVGKPGFKKKLAEPAMRAWRRWIQSPQELHLIGRWGSNASEEAQRMLKRACESINEKTQPTQPIRPPRITWPAVQKIVKEAGGRPGRMNELIKRALSASIRDGGRTIGYRFLLKADALRSPAMQWYKLRRAATAEPQPQPQQAGPKKKFFFDPRGKSMKERTQNPRIPEHPLGWMRYALGTLLVIFALGAGWGVSSWLSIDADPNEVVLLGEETGEIEESTSPAPVAEADPNDPWASTDEWEPINIDEPYSTAGTEPVKGYPLEDLREPEGTPVVPVESTTLSASLEADFNQLEAQSLAWKSTLQQPQIGDVPANPAPAGETTEETASSEAPVETVAVDAASSLDDLEDFNLDEPKTALEEKVKVDAEPLNAEALDIPEALVNQTASIGTLSVSAPKETAAQPKRSSPTAASSPPSRSPAPAPEPASSGRPDSRKRLLEAMSKLERSLK